MPVWFPLKQEISSHLLVQFISNHTGIVPKEAGPEFGDSNNLHHESGRMMEWEDKGWSLWQIAENEKRAVQKENQELVRRINKLEQSAKEVRAGSETSSAMDSLLVQLEEAVLKMMNHEQQSTGGIHTQLHSRMMQKEAKDKTNGECTALDEECSPSDNKECTANGCLEQHQPDQDNSPIQTG